MDYDDLYDESPYVSKEVRRRGGVMTTMRAIFWICATILASVIAIIFYGYQQDQYVITSGGNFVSIFDRKSKTLNICDKGNCTVITPMLETRTPMVAGSPQASLASQIINPQQGAQPGQRLIGSFPQHQSPANPQMAGGNPQANQQMAQPHMAQPQMATQQQSGAANPQAQQMMQQLQQMELMAQQTVNQPMSPQRIQQIRQRRAVEDQALAANLLNPQMIQQVRQLRAMEDQQLAQAQQRPNAQPVSGNAQGGQVQMTGGAQEQTAANGGDNEADNAGGDEGNEEAATDETAAEDTGTEETKTDTTAKADESEGAEETEEAAPV